MKIVVRTVNISIHAPVQTLFDYVSDLTRHPEWSDGELKIEEVVPGPIGVGKMYRSWGQVGPQKNRLNQLQVTDFDPPISFGFRAADPLFGKVLHIFTFDQKGDMVIVTRTMSLHLHPLMEFAFSIFIYPFIGRPAMNKSMTKLKLKFE